PRGAPSQLAVIPDQTNVVNASGDGRVVYQREQLVTKRVRADLAAATLAPSPVDPQGWDLVGTSLDGKTTFYRAKTGTERVELIAAGGGAPGALAPVGGSVLVPRLSPAGAAVLSVRADAGSHALSLWRASVAGGEPRVIEALPYRPAARDRLT